MTSTHKIAFVFALLGSAYFGQYAHAQAALEYEQGDLPALFEEIEPDDARAIERYQGWTRKTGIKRSRLVKVNFDLLRPIEDGDESYPLFFNLFPDLGFHIYIHRRIKRYYGYDWLASPDPEYDGRRFIDLSVSIGDHAHTGMHAVINFRDLGFEGMLIRRMDGTDYVAIIEYDGSLWGNYPTSPDYHLQQSTSLLLSKKSNSFIAETSVRVDYWALDFFFPNDSVGYLLNAGGDMHGTPARLYKTEDGGRNWSLVSDALPGTPRSMYFRSPTEGYIWSRRNVVCEKTDPCKNSLLKTLDGGISWAPMEEPGLISTPSILDATIDGAMFGIARRPSADHKRWMAVLVKSDDGAETWSDVYQFPEIGRLAAASGFDGVLYLGFQKGTIYAIDPSSRKVEEISVGVVGPTDLMGIVGLKDFGIASNEIMVAEVADSDGRRLVRTTDRGASWTTIKEGFFKLVAVPSAEEIVIIFNKGSSAPTDTATSSDVVAYSDDGGISWEESALVGGLIMNTGRRQSVDGSVHKLLLSDRILSIRIPKSD